MWTNKNNTSVDNKAASAEAVISTVKIIQPVTFYHATGRLVKLAGLKGLSQVLVGTISSTLES